MGGASEAKPSLRLASARRYYYLEYAGDRVIGVALGYPEDGEVSPPPDLRKFKVKVVGRLNSPEFLASRKRALMLDSSGAHLKFERLMKRWHMLPRYSQIYWDYIIGPKKVDCRFLRYWDDWDKVLGFKVLGLKYIFYLKNGEERVKKIHLTKRRIRVDSVIRMCEKIHERYGFKSNRLNFDTIRYRLDKDGF